MMKRAREGRTSARASGGGLARSCEMREASLMRAMSTVGVSLAAAVCLSVAAARCGASPEDPPRVKVEFRRAQDEAAPGYNKRRIEGTADSVYVHDAADFVPTPDDIVEAKVGKDELLRPMVVIRFAAP